MKVLRTAAFCASLLLLAGCQVDLYSRLAENEANEIVATLLRHGISASRHATKDGSSVVKVDERSFADAMTVLNDAGLPKQKFSSIGDVFADTKLISSPMEERARFIYALSQELAKTLSEIDGVIAARVHLVLPKNDPLREEQKPSSASVFIKHDPTLSVAALLPQIKTLVANGVEGLNYDKVTVVFVQGQKTAQRNSQTTALASSSMFPSLPVADNEVWFAGGALGCLLTLGIILSQANRIAFNRPRNPKNRQSD